MPESRSEPCLRVGVALPSDQMRRIGLLMPDWPYRMILDGCPMDGPPAGEVEVVRDEFGVSLRRGGSRSRPAGVLMLTPIGEPPPRRGAGVRVEGLLTGRGFHWQKQTDFTLSGTLEFRASGDYLLAVNVLPLEQYLSGVITAEMSGACPLEFLKSQTLVARAWLLAHSEDKHPGLPIDRCNDDCCQRYQGTTFLSPAAVAAVAATRGQVMFHAGGGIVDANYSKNCGGIIEAPEYVWGTAKPGQRSAVDAPEGSPAARFLPVTQPNLVEYLTGSWLADTDCFCGPNVVPEDQVQRYLGGVDEGGGHFRWRVRYRREELERILREKCRNLLESAGRMETLTGLRPVRRGVSGRLIELTVEYLDSSGRARTATITGQYEIRDALHERFLYSSAFDVAIERDDRDRPVTITLAGAGWGHGAGFCQIGALGMALRGYDAERIVRHYFDGIEIRTCY